MSPKKQEALVSRFPFLKSSGNLREDLMMFGLMCEDGWYKLIKKLCLDIEKELKRSGQTDFQVLEVKEKWGGLRYYTSGTSEEILELIDKAEHDSYSICEKCGKPGKLKDWGWWQTLCDKHMKEELT